MVDGVTTLNPGDPATVGVILDGSNVRFNFGSLRGTADTIQLDLQRLLSQMNASIAEADRFVQTL